MDWSRTSKPASFAEPLVGAMKQVRMRRVVDLPAPLGPRKPTISPLPTWKERSSTATTPGYVLVRLLTSIMGQYQRRTRREELSDDESNPPSCLPGAARINPSTRFARSG